MRPADRCRPAGLLLLLGLGLCALSARADDDGPESLENLLRQEVQGPSRYAQSLLDAPAAVSVLGQREAAGLGHQTLGDMLQRLPGIYLSDSRLYSSVGMRGFNRPGDYNSRLLVAIDGFRVNDAIYDQALPQLEFPLLANWIKRVELVQGPGSSVYGGNALLGVVNVVTLDGADAPGSRGLALLGSAGERRLMLQHGRGGADPSDRFIGLNVQRRRGETLELPELGLAPGALAGLDGERQASLFAKYRSGPWRLSVAAMQRLKEAATAPYGTLAGVPGTEFRDAYGYAELAYEEGWSSDWRRSLRVSAARSVFNGRYVYALDPAPLINRDLAAAAWMGAEARLQWRGWLNHELLLGAEARLVPKGEQRNFDEDPAQTYLDSRPRQQALGLFVQDLWRLSERWQLTTGLRLDHIRSFDSAWSPRLALVYRPGPSESLKLLLSRAFRAPNLFERFYDDNGASQIANPALRPERISAIELAWERALDERTLFSANLYANRMRQLIELVPLDLHDDSVGQFRNVSGLRMRGLDLGLEQRRAGSLEWRANLSLIATHQDGRRLSNSPRWLFKGHALLPLGQRLGLGAEWLAMGARSGREPVGRLALAHVLLRYRGDGGSQLLLRVLNLADARSADPATPDNALLTVPRPGRAWQLEWQQAF